ncbi:jg4373 [Pararge aegeria aegeria]|uniref:Jg4373 protein n=1 Tax=Pararge aegeria aegeria TaxID=348720 RepID=A0A8S4R9F5_9NEOP|nr:jg4373 [Pararge aegeria aegeria]
MNSFAVLLLFVQACLVQNVFSQCCGGAYGPGLAGAYGGYGAYGAYGANGAYGLAGPALAAPLAYGAAYGGEGVGDVAVAGQLPVAGTTLVAGQVPILGAVEFGGIVPAGGEVSIAGSCGCGCRGSYLY